MYYLSTRLSNKGSRALRCTACDRIAVHCIMQCGGQLSLRRSKIDYMTAGIRCNTTSAVNRLACLMRHHCCPSLPVPPLLSLTRSPTTAVPRMQSRRCCPSPAVSASVLELPAGAAVLLSAHRRGRQQHPQATQGAHSCSGNSNNRAIQAVRLPACNLVCNSATA